MDAYAPRLQNITESFETYLLMFNSAINKMVEEIANNIELRKCKKLLADLQQGGEQKSSASEEDDDKAAAASYLTGCKQQRDDPPKNSLPQLMATASDDARKCWTELSKNGFFNLPKIKDLKNANRVRLIQECVRQGVPFTVAMMDYLEYPKHIINDLKLSKEKYYYHLSAALGLSYDNVKKNCLSLTDDKYHYFKIYLINYIR